MEALYSLIVDVMATAGSLFAAGNFDGLSPAQRAEAIKQLAGFTAGLSTMPQTAGMGFVRGKIASLPGKALPTSPQRLSAGLVRWQIDMSRHIGDALSGDQEAAERAVRGVHRLGDYMAGREDE